MGREAGGLEVAGGRATLFVPVLVVGQRHVEANMSGGGSSSGTVAPGGAAVARLHDPEVHGGRLFLPLRQTGYTFFQCMFSQDGYFLCMLTFSLLFPLCGGGGGGLPLMSISLAPPRSGGSLH